MTRDDLKFYQFSLPIGILCSGSKQHEKLPIAWEFGELRQEQSISKIATMLILCMGYADIGFVQDDENPYYSCE